MIGLSLIKQDIACSHIAKSIVQGVSYSMNLEQQGVKKTTTDKQIKQLALELKQDLDPRLWIKNK